MERQTVVRLLIVLAIAVPLLVEGFTLLGLIGFDLSGGEDAGDAAGTPTPDAVGVGDDVLPETEEAEILQTASLKATDDGLRLTLSVRVDNTGNGTYTFQLESVTTSAGDSVEPQSGTSSVDVPAGEQRSVTAQWTLSEGARPDRVQVVAVRKAPDGSTTETIRSAVYLSPIPVQG